MLQTVDAAGAVVVEVAGADVDVDVGVADGVGFVEVEVVRRRAPQTRPLWVPLLVAFLVQQELVVGIQDTSMQVSVCAQSEMQDSRVNVEAAPCG